MRVELLTKDVESAGDILGPFVDDVEVGVRLDKTAGRGAHGGAHVGDVEAAIRLGADLVGDRGKDAAVALLERGAVRVAGVKVERRVLQAGEQKHIDA